MNEIEILCNTLSYSLKKHFCKNYNIPIKIFYEPYFSERCILFNEYFGIEEKLREYVTDVLLHDNEQAFFAEDNEIMQSVIDYLKSNPDMVLFSEKEDMNKFAVPERYRNLPSKDVWRDSCVGKTFMSIDLKKANFQALRHYSDKIFDDSDTWEDFIGKFTDMQSKINSKHLRQVIFGSVNPKRQITYEKYLMCKILDEICMEFSFDNIYSLSNDEIIINAENIFVSQITYIRNQIKSLGFNCHINVFSVAKLGKDMYEQMFIEEISDDSRIKFKKVNHLMMPFVIRKINGEEPTESDYVFINESGNLCRFLENPLTR